MCIFKNECLLFQKYLTSKYYLPYFMKNDHNQSLKTNYSMSYWKSVHVSYHMLFFVTIFFAWGNWYYFYDFVFLDLVMCENVTNNKLCESSIITIPVFKLCWKEKSQK